MNYARNLPRYLLEQIETYMYEHIRILMSPQWKVDAWGPDNHQLYKRLQQSPTESWLNKTQSMTMLTQTQGAKTIHPEERMEMRIPKLKLKAKWGLQNQAIQEQLIQTQKRRQGQTHGAVRYGGETEIDQLISTQRCRIKWI